MSLYIYFDRIITNLLVSSMLRLFLLNVYQMKVFVRLVLKIENIKHKCFSGSLCRHLNH